MGPNARADIERRAGGNPSSNVGVDYRRQLGRSSQRHLVQQAYREAGLDLGADLDRLASGERIAADPEAVGYMYRYGVPHGRTATPVITLHNTGDGGAVPDQAGWYAAQVRKSGDPAKLRQVYVDRGMHCAFSAAEEILTLRALFERVDTGRWPDTRPPAEPTEQGRGGLRYGVPPRLRHRDRAGRRDATGVHDVPSSGIPAPVPLKVVP
ncbi:hypothetical protein [Actinopolymorpha pittospori]|uniref:Uncharacterized protein n=1 Tax=Actinopolymorpha pittospori TaxID=648752 RepID=A0A927RI90_9ACTN|nr:hypothetical protein [Actinopolymorpha pittospori]MBE1605926.1 hypothetical protein [Actinopolymorpha pittospori]